jgi:hypothetical protein
MGEANLPQFRHPTPEQRMEQEALRGRAAALRIVRARRSGAAVDAYDVREIQEAQRKISTMTVAVERRDGYLRCFAAVLRENDRLSGPGAVEAFSEMPRNSSLLYDDNDDLPLTEGQSAAIANAMSRLALGR